MTDSELLHDYASSGCEDAFTALVGRYTNLVYSAALRQTGNRQAAEEAAQVVFIILARKAATLPKETILAGWLWRTTRFVSLNAARREAHRLRTEEDLARSYQTETEAAWTSLAPVLDEVLEHLGEKDRDTVILRCFEQRSFREISQWLGTSEDGAQKRFSRALDKLRTTLHKRGVVLTSTVLVAAISARAAQAAPSGLATALAHATLTGPGVSGATAVQVRTALEGIDSASRRTMALRSIGGAILILLVCLCVRLYTIVNSTPTAPRANVSVAARPVVDATLAGRLMSPALAQPNLGQIRLLLLDTQTKRPLANAQVEVNWSAELPFSASTNQQATDRQGQAVINFDPAAQEPWELLVVIRKAGFVPKFVSWSAARGDLLEDLPATYTTTSERGIVAAGLVTDEKGVPLPNVLVKVEGSRPDVFIVSPVEREGSAINHTEVTDSEGRWTCDHLPPQLDSIRFTFSHPEYLGETVGCAKLGSTTGPSQRHFAESDLLEGTAVLSLQPGLVVAGSVRNPQEQPVVGAKVIANHRWWDVSSSRTTDASGQFLFKNIAPGDLVLTAQAEGYLDADAAVELTKPPGTVRFVLAPAATLRGRVLDARRNPIVGARVFSERGEEHGLSQNWSTRTEADGRFRWLSAPPSLVNCRFSAAGYKTRVQELIPNGLEQEVTLEPGMERSSCRVAGRVLESRSRKPVDQFEVWTTTLGPHGPSGFPTPVGLGAELRTGTNGSFSFLMRDAYVDPVENVVIEVRAQGYLPAQRTFAGPITNRVRLSLDLEPAPLLEGTVQLPDGAPAPGTVVMLADRKAGAIGYMELPAQFNPRLSTAAHTETDEQGRFVLPAKSMSGILLAASLAGYAEIVLQKGATRPVLRLQPWGKIAGTLRIGDHGATNRPITIGNDYEDDESPNAFLLGLTAVTDMHGGFAIEGVPPGEWRIEPHHQRVRVLSGETTHVELGGGGVRLTGRIVSKNPSEPLNASVFTVALSTKCFPVSVPKCSQFESLQEYISAKSKWLTQEANYRHSQAGHAARRDLRAYSSTLERDGNFTIEEVLPGTYELVVAGNPLHLDPLQMALLGDSTTDVLITSPDPGTPAVVDIGTVDVGLSKK